jgi:hypothetical protein
MIGARLSHVRIKQNQTLSPSLSPRRGEEREGERDSRAANRNRFREVPDDIHRRDAMSDIAERLDDGLKLVDNLATTWEGGDLAAAVRQLTEWAYWVRESED